MKHDSQRAARERCGQRRRRILEMSAPLDVRDIDWTQPPRCRVDPSVLAVLVRRGRGVGPCVVVANHRSPLDVVALLAASSEPRFVAAAELGRVSLPGVANVLAAA